MNFVANAETQFKDSLSRAGGLGERSFREQAWAAFGRLGLPDRKNELWKYTSLAGVTRGAWAPADSGNLLEEAGFLKERYGKDFEVITVVNGRPEGPLPAGVSAFTFHEPAGEFEDGWTALTAAVAKPGFELHVKKGVKLAKPLLVIHAASGESGSFAAAAHRFVLEENSAAEIAEIYLGGAGDYLRSEISFVKLQRSAVLSWVRIQNESARGHHFSSAVCELEESARLYATVVNGGAVWSRSGLRADISGPLAEAHISGLTFARGQQHSDQRVEVKHLAGQTVSSQLFKGVLKDRARGVLNGKIYIARGAQKVMSSQLNHNLLLTPQAEADTKPELEIYADDVKANHGASIGRLDEGKVFYLMSRGIPRAAARQMLAEAFVADVLMKIPSPPLLAFARERVQALLPEFSSELEAKI